MSKKIEKSVGNIFIIIKNNIKGKDIKTIFHFTPNKRKYSSVKKINDDNNLSVLKFKKRKKIPLTTKNNFHIIINDNDDNSFVKNKDKKDYMNITKKLKNNSHSKFKARPCPSFTYMEVKKSNKPLTIGHEPNLYTKKRFYERENKKNEN